MRLTSKVKRKTSKTKVLTTRLDKTNEICGYKTKKESFRSVSKILTLNDY